MPDGSSCYIEEKPWRGVNCSDAVGHQVPYGEIVSNYTKLGNATYDPYSETVYLDFKGDGGKWHQMWFDDVKSYQIKYEFISQLKLRGEKLIDIFFGLNNFD